MPLQLFLFLIVLFKVDYIHWYVHILAAQFWQIIFLIYTSIIWDISTLFLLCQKIPTHLFPIFLTPPLCAPQRQPPFWFFSPYISVEGRRMVPKDVQDLIPGTCKYVTLHGKGELGLQREIRLLNSRPYNREIILNYLNGLNIITRVLKSWRGR